MKTAYTQVHPLLVSVFGDILKLRIRPSRQCIQVYTIYMPMQSHRVHGGQRINLSFTIENVFPFFFLIRFIYYSLCFVLLSLAQQIGIDKKGKQMWCL